MLCHSLLALIVLLQVPSQRVEEVLRRIEEGAPPEHVSRELGRAAVERVRPDIDAQTLDGLAHIARAGDAQALLAERLVGILAQSGPAAERAVCLLAGLPAEDLPPAWPADVPLYPLVDLATGEDEAAALAAAGLVGRWAAPQDVTALLDAWVEEQQDRARALLAVLPENRRATPAEWIHAIAERWYPPTTSWLVDLSAAARQLALRDVAAADAALEKAGMGSFGPAGATLRAVGGVPLDDPERWDRARSLIGGIIEAAAHEAAAVEPTILEAAIRAATDLYLPELPPSLPSFVLPNYPTGARVAAIEALKTLTYRSGPTIDVLIDLLDDSDGLVASTAGEVLRAKSGKRMPGRKPLWERWRASVELPDGPPGESAEAWLEKIRVSQASVRRFARELEEEERAAALTR